MTKAMEIEIFGAEVEEMTANEMECYMARMKAAGEEMDKFFETIPSHINPDLYFDIYMMSEREREAFYKANEPVICSNCGNVCVHGQDHWDCQLGIVERSKPLQLKPAPADMDSPYIQARLNNHKREVCGGIRF